MRRVLIISSQYAGHVNPLIGVAQWLQRLGCEVSWLTYPKPLERLRQYRIPLYEATLSAPPPPRNRDDPGELRAMVEQAISVYADLQVPELRRAISDFRPQAVVINGRAWSAAIAASLEAVPFAVVSSSLRMISPRDFHFPDIEDQRRMAPARDALFARHGVRARFKQWDIVSPWLNTVPTTPELAGPDADVPEKTLLVGACLPLAPEGGASPGFPWARLGGDRPVVYVAFGSVLVLRDLLRTLAAAVEPLPVQLVLSAGPLADDPGFLETLPKREDAIVVPSTPQLALLPRVAAFVNHGGANSVNEALHHGVPLLLVPMSSDQPVQAHFVSRSGAGLVVQPEEATAERCRALLAQLLEDGSSFKVNARRISRSYQQHDGARLAAEAIFQLAQGSS